MGTRGNWATRFWNKVNRSGEDDCWLWIGAVFQDTGYGQFRYKSKPTTAHRISFLLEHGHLPAGDTCHTCDNRLCVNPAHLFEGTRTDNMRDAKEKGRLSTGANHARSVDPLRRARGETNGMHKLNASQVLGIILLRSKGLSLRAIAIQFDVSHKTIYKIVSGETWKHLTGGVS